MVSLMLAYFFLKPAGHFGLTAFTFFITLPLAQVIVFWTGTGLIVAVGVGVTSTFSCSSLTVIFGLEKVNPLAESFIHPSFSVKVDVAIFELPSAFVIETLALIGAEENL